MHEHEQESKLFEFRAMKRNKLIISLIITSIVMVIEVLGGIIINSVALLSDAGHMFTHAFAISIGLIAIQISRKPPCNHKTYGLYRAEVLAAFINGLFLLVMVGLIIFEAIERIFSPEDIDALSMLFIALIGLATNITSIAILQGSQKGDINIKGVFFHMFGDAITSVGIIAVAIIIYFTDWNFLDPIVSVAIAIVILSWAIGVLKESATILLEIGPEGLETDIIRNEVLKNFPQILEMFHIHVWTITSDVIVLSAYIKLKKSSYDIVDQSDLVIQVNQFLHEKFNFKESTVQVVPKDAPLSCNIF